MALGKKSQNSSPTPNGTIDSSSSSAAASLTMPAPTTSGASTTSSSRASTPNSVDSKPPPDGKAPDEISKLRTFLSILKRFIGVSDMAAVRFSLPAQLMEPIPNLEYWHYLDRPETFATIGDSEDALERMLAALRFWFTKDLKYVHGKPCKPYNSTLGEFFRCWWEVEEGAESIGGSIGGEGGGGGGRVAGTDGRGGKVHVDYLTEQTSHHPPVSAFFAECPEKGISACGYDQLSAKFTGTSIKVTAGQYNKGIFLTLHHRNDEEYIMTHPAAYLVGLLRGNLHVTVSDTCTITCLKTGLKVLLHYLEEGYFGKTQNKVEGVIYRPSDIYTDSATRIRDIPDSQVLGRLEGVWTQQIFYSPGPLPMASNPERRLFIDVQPLRPVPKLCPPYEQQLPNESRKFWKDVTEMILNKQYSAATNRKQELEERQRERAAERKEAGREWKPRFFTHATEDDGRPVLTDEGREVMKGLGEGRLELREPEEYGAI